MNKLSLNVERCGNCRWMRKRDTVQPLPSLPDDKNGGKGIVLTIIFCHRFPTVLRTEDTHWCGEWKEKEMRLV